MKEQYEAVNMEIIEFDKAHADVITTSLEHDEDED